MKTFKKYNNIKGELRIKTATEIAIRDGLPAAKEYIIKNLGLSERSWDTTYKPRVMKAMKSQETTNVKIHNISVKFVKASEL